MTSRLRTLIGGAAMLAAFAIGTASVATAQTITVSGCASFTTVGQVGTSNVQITCNTTGGGGSTPPSCGLPSLTTVGTTLTFSATCTQGTNPITSVIAAGVAQTPINPTGGYTVAGIPIPTVTTSYTITASDGQGGIGSNSATYVVSGGGGGGVDMSGCTALGYNGRYYDTAYPVTTNILPVNSIYSKATPLGGLFGNNAALVIRFTTPSLGVNDEALPNLSAEPGTQGGSRQATIGTAPCLIPTASVQNTPPVVRTMISGSPSFTMRVVPGGACNISPFSCGNYTWLAPNTTYYITVVNKGTWVGPANTCGSGNCDMRFDFNN